MDPPVPVSGVDQESFGKILSVPWLRDSVMPTGLKWGRQIADVEMSRLPSPLLGQVMMIPSTDDEVLLVIYRWDRYSHEGWKESFKVELTFPDGSRYEVEVPPSYRLLDGHSMRIPITTTVRERPQQMSRNIPRVVYNLSAPAEKQVSHEVRRLLSNNRRMTNLLQCNCLYLVLEDEACRREVESSEIPNFVAAYNALRSGSYKADLMRYYLLYKYGGVYLDDKTLIHQSLDSSAFDNIFKGGGSGGERNCDLFICSHLTPEIAFMASRRGSPIMFKALEVAIDKIMRREYTNHRLGITGNYMFTKVMRSQEGNNEEIEEQQRQPEAVENRASSDQLAKDINAKWFRYWGEMCAMLPVIFSNDGILVHNKFLWQRQAIPTSDWPRSANHYTSLWTQRRVYVDGNPEASGFRNLLASPEAATLLHVSIAVVILVAVGFIVSRYPPISWI